MSTGGVYQLIANDGAQDKLLLATELLNKRLKEIQRLRAKHPAISDSTPTLADIERTHVLFINSHYKPYVAVGYEYGKIGVQEGLVRLGKEVTFSIPQFGDFFNDMVLHVQLRGLTTTAGNQVRYCDFLGHRLIQRVRFEVNGNFLDEYGTDVMNMHYNYTVPSDKRLSWLRCIGQETPHQGLITLNPGVDEYREVKQIVDGPQTPKQSHEVVDLWIPLLLWFCLDSRLSIPSVSIPYGQRFIKILFAPASLIARGTPAANYTPPSVEICELYINNLFVNPEIHDLFIRRIGFSLIRVHRQNNLTVTDSSGQLKLDQLKYPTETLYIGLRPTINLSSMEDWHRYYFVDDRVVPYPVAIPNPVPPPLYLNAFSTATYKLPIQTLDTISLETHAIEIYPTIPAQFFRKYVPYRFGDNINAPDDPGLLMVTFNLYPGAYQPSGHLNLSRSREFYLYYSSSVVSSTVPCEMVVCAVALNFLLIADGSAALRYNT
jgi:hypothetical protein